MCCSIKQAWITIAIVSSILALAAMGGAIAGLLAYHCVFSPGVSSFRLDNIYFTYIIYFYNLKCIDTASDYIVHHPEPSQRTWYWSVAYLIVSTLWLISSFILMKAVSYFKTPNVNRVTYPWLVMTFIVYCMDTAACVTYGLDFEHLQTKKDMVDWVGIINARTLEQFEYFPVSFIIMLIYFSKGIVFWVLNIINFFIIYVLLARVSKKESRILLESRPPQEDYYGAAINPAYITEMTEITPEQSSYPSQSPLSTSGQYVNAECYDPDNWVHETFQPKNIIPRVRQSGGFYDSETQWKRSYPEDYSRQHPYAYDNYQERQYQQAPRVLMKTPQNKYPPEFYNNAEPWTYLPSAPDPSFHYKNDTTDRFYH